MLQNAPDSALGHYDVLFSTYSHGSGWDAISLAAVSDCFMDCLMSRDVLKAFGTWRKCHIKPRCGIMETGRGVIWC